MYHVSIQRNNGDEFASETQHWTINFLDQYTTKYQNYRQNLSVYPCLESSWRSRPLPVPISSTLQEDKYLSFSSTGSDLRSSTWFSMWPRDMLMHKLFVQEATTSMTSAPNLMKGGTNQKKKFCKKVRELWIYLLYYFKEDSLNIYMFICSWVQTKVIFLKMKVDYTPADISKHSLHPAVQILTFLWYYKLDKRNHLNTMFSILSEQ